MSRRERRDSDSRRHYSRFDREPSPKRSRRDGKPETERLPSNNNVGEQGDREQKNRRRLQDALPLEGSEAPDSKVENGAVGKQTERKHDATHDGEKRSSDPTEIPRSRTYFQHDERGNAAHVGRSFGRRAAPERGWRRDSRDQHDERVAKRYDKRQRDEKPEGKGDDNGNWHHDRFFEMEANPPLPPPPPPPPPAARKRPAFSEKKLPANSESVDKTAKEPEKGRRVDQTASLSERREDRDRNPRHSGRHGRLSAVDQVPGRGEAHRSGFSSRERHGGGGGGSFRERDRFSGRQGYHSGSTGAEKWKHDLFDEANKSPQQKNEEDQIAKLEALLDS